MVFIVGFHYFLIILQYYFSCEDRLKFKQNVICLTIAVSGIQSCAQYFGENIGGINITHTHDKNVLFLFQMNGFLTRCILQNRNKQASGNSGRLQIVFSIILKVLWVLKRSVSIGLLVAQTRPSDQKQL